MNFLTRSLIFRNLLLSLLTLGLVLVITISLHPKPMVAMTNRTPINNAAAPNHQAIALTLVNQLVQGKFTEAATNFSPEMLRNVTTEQLQQAWTAITQDLGNFQEIKDVTRQILGGREVFIIVCQFAKDSFRVQIGVNSDRQIAGLYFIPNEVAQVFTLPNYAEPSKTWKYY